MMQAEGVLWIRAFHIIAMVAWFAGLFYLPRIFVYHAGEERRGELSLFPVMERRLYFAIMWPAAVVTTVLGLWMLFTNPGYYLHAGWMHAKLGLVILLWGYHLACGYYVRAFAAGRNRRNARFFRIFNEVPTLLLISIVVLVIVRP